MIALIYKVVSVALFAPSPAIMHSIVFIHAPLFYRAVEQFLMLMLVHFSSQSLVRIAGIFRLLILTILTGFLASSGKVVKSSLQKGL